MASYTEREFHEYYVSLKGSFFKEYSTVDSRDIEEMLNDAFLYACCKFERNYDKAKCPEKPFFLRLLKNAFIDKLRVLTDEKPAPLVEDFCNFLEQVEIDNLTTSFDEIADHLRDTGLAPFLTNDNLLNKNAQFSKLLLKRSAWSDNKSITPKTLLALLNKKIGGFELSGFLSSDTPFSLTRIQAWLACSTLFDEPE